MCVPPRDEFRSPPRAGFEKWMESLPLGQGVVGRAVLLVREDRSNAVTPVKSTSAFRTKFIPVTRASTNRPKANKKVCP